VRTLTFLFSDLRDYTAFVERHGDVAATTLIADYRRVVRTEVAKAKGAEAKTELGIALEFWRKAKATWYLGQLREWAAKRGIELTEAETAGAS